MKISGLQSRISKFRIRCRVDQFPRENYAQYEDEVALWVNEDTSLKPHERYVLDAGEWGTTDAMANKEAETVNSKYVVVKDAGRELF